MDVGDILRGLLNREFCAYCWLGQIYVHVSILTQHPCFNIATRFEGEAQERQAPHKHADADERA